MVQEICRSLHLDLTGQTSASYNMRLNYEKCLLDFERYLASGRYNADLAVGTAPPSDVLEAPPAVRPSQGGFAAVASEPHQSGYSTRGASRMAAGLPPSSISGVEPIRSSAWDVTHPKPQCLACAHYYFVTAEQCQTQATSTLVLAAALHKFKR